MAKHIKAIIIANPTLTIEYAMRDLDTNTHCLISQHIKSAAFLPEGHLVYSTLAMAAVERYLRYDNCKFLRETQEVSSFSIDFLKSVEATLNTLYVNSFSYL